MKAMNLYHDLDGGNYYKIDKNSGEITKSNKQGTDPIRFKAQYSGSSYRLRKKTQRDLSPPSLIKQPFKTHLEHKHTKFIEKKNHLENYQNKIQNKSLKSLRIKQICKTDRFQQKLKSFTKFRESLTEQNHSPRSHLQGSLPTLKIAQGGVRQQIDEKPILYRQSKHIKSFPILSIKIDENLPGNLLMKNQIKRQKQIFKKYHPHFYEQVNQRQLKQLMERKKNLKILQKLNLDKNDRITSQVYE